VNCPARLSPLRHCADAARVDLGGCHHHWSERAWPKRRHPGLDVSSVDFDRIVSDIRLTQGIAQGVTHHGRIPGYFCFRRCSVRAGGYPCGRGITWIVARASAELAEHACSGGRALLAELRPV
jgi:hypothetical protein